MQATYVIVSLIVATLTKIILISKGLKSVVNSCVISNRFPKLRDRKIPLYGSVTRKGGGEVSLQTTTKEGLVPPAGLDPQRGIQCQSPFVLIMSKVGYSPCLN